MTPLRCFLTVTFLFVAVPQLVNVEPPTAGIFLALPFAGLLMVRSHWPPPDADMVRWAFQGMIILGFLFLTTSFFPIGAWMARPLMLPPRLEKADAIVVLAAGTYASGAPTFSGLQRTLHGFTLFKKGLAPLLILSTSEVIEPSGVRESGWVASLAALVGVASPQVEIVQEGTTTRTEALAIIPRLESRGVRRILLVTNGAHIFRSVKTFARHGLEVLPAPVQTAGNAHEARESYWGSFYATVHEWLGIGVYWLRGDISLP